MAIRNSRAQRSSTDRSAAKAVIAAARRQFFVHGFRRVSMDDLATELGISKKTLYAYFPSKTILVEAVLPGVDEKDNVAFSDRQRSLGGNSRLFSTPFPA